MLPELFKKRQEQTHSGNSQVRFPSDNIENNYNRPAGKSASTKKVRYVDEDSEQGEDSINRLQKISLNTPRRIQCCNRKI